MTNYEIILYWSSEGDAFIAAAPEFPGCAADGATRQQALANAETEIQEGSKPLRNWAGRSLSRKHG
jgi:predicted RNase H-like HicB family nuclease